MHTDSTDDLYELFPLDDLDLAGQIDLYLICMILYDLYDLAHVAGWEPYGRHDLGHVSWAGSATIQILHGIS